MSADLKGKYEVQKLIRDSVMACFTYFGVTGWQCAEASQQKILKLDNVVLMKFASASPAGWPKEECFTPEETAVTGMTRRVTWIEIQSWTLQVLSKRTTAQVNADTLTVEDVVGYLMQWFNLDGCTNLRLNGLSCLRVTQKDVKIYNDDSSVPQNTADITLRVCIQKVKTESIPNVEVLKPSIYPI